ncbi:MAG: Wzy polymerase domain-containing protein [Burkholderiaceae bacterium]|nr:Wzy polymerase domain-containing protein [Burkholderiaceae bacterium]MDZ4145793.1 Wzy polymerase domain-containing protein [Burkholderiales bacterium]
MLLHPAVAAALLALPWLWPWTGGPSVAVVPWLATLGCVGLALLLAPGAGEGVGARGAGDAGRLVRLAASSWLLAAGLSALMGVAQFAGWPAVWAAAGASSVVNGVDVAGGAGSPVAVLARWAASWVNTPPAGEVYGNLRQRNQFATLMNIGLAALLFVAARWAGAGTRIAPRPARAAALAPWALAALLVAGNVLSKSRTGLAELVLLCALAWVWAAHRPRGVRRLVMALLPMYAGFSVALAALGYPAVWQRMTDGAPACSSRITLWRNVLELIAQKPWGGWGWGELDYAHYAHLYGGERFCDILDNAHNLPLHLAVELGLPLALAASALVAWGLWRGQPWREAHPARQLAWSVLAVLALHSLLEYPLWYGPFQLALWLCLGLLWQVPRRPHGAAAATAMATIATTTATTAATAATANYEQNRPLAPVKWRLFAIVLIVVTAGAAWDYHRISQLYRLPEERAAAYRTDTLAKVSGSWLFDSPVAFAALTTTPLTPGNAAQQFAQATALLHYSPEPRIIERVIESAVMLHRDDAALWHLARFRAAFPAEHAAWAAALARPVSPAAGAGGP